MTDLSDLGDHFNRIGVAAVQLAGPDAARILVYAEMADWGDDIIFLAAKRGEIEFHTPEADVMPVADALREAWLFSQSRGPQHKWEAVALRVEDRKLAVSLLYPGEVEVIDSMFEKQDRLVDTYFPGMR